MTTDRPRLLVMNMAMDADDPILGFTTSWVNALAARCEQVDVLTMRRGALRVAPNVRVASLGAEHGWSRARRLRRLAVLAERLVDPDRVDAVFVHMSTLLAIAAGPFARTRGVPLTLWYAHGSANPRLRVAARLADNVVTSTRAGFPLTDPEPIVVGQGIDAARHRPRPPDTPPRILIFGRISRRKHVDVALRAVAAASRDDLVTEIVGPEWDAGYVAELRSLIADLGMADRVVWHGAVAPDDVPDVLAGATALVTASATGSLDKTTLEALAAGVPVIAANTSCAAVVRRIDPALARSRTPEDLAAGLDWVLRRSQDQHEVLRAAGRDLVAREHSLDALAERLMRVVTSAA